MNIDTAQLVIIRGLPGSGKSTLAKEIANELGFIHVENDMFFMMGGEYVYDRSKLGDAIRWCEARVRRLIEQGKRVVVSNTFIKRAHLWSMTAMAEDDRCLVIECMAQYGNTHGVPPEVLARMASEWEDYPNAFRVGEEQIV